MLGIVPIHTNQDAPFLSKESPKRKICNNALLGLAIITTLAITGPLAAQEISRQVRVTSDFWEGGITWGGVPGGYVTRYYVFYERGTIELCGVGTSTNAHTRQFEITLMRSAKLLMDKRPILEDLSFFARVPRPSDLATAMTNCRVIRMNPPNKTVTFEIDFPRKRFRL